MVLLHGFPQDGSAYDAVVPLLHERGMRTLVPTQRGYVEGARPSGRGDYSVAAVTGDLVALLDAAGLARAHIVGHDWGAAPAWAIAAWHPQRVASLTVLSTPHPAAMQTALLTSTQAVRSWYMGLFQLPLLPELLLSRTLQRVLVASGLPRDCADRYAETMRRAGALTGALSWYRGIPFSSSSPIGSVTAPTTYIWGRRDVALGRTAAERTGDHVTGPYHFEELDAGHWLPETRPTEVAAAVLERAGR